MAMCRDHGYYDVLEGAAPDCPFCLSAAMLSTDMRFSDDVKPSDGVRHFVDKVVEMNTKETNPKDAVGVRKVPMSCVPANVLAELGLAMMEGARKYGRHNYRVAGIRTSVYYDAALRHLFAFWEGEDIDPDSGLTHVVKAIATLVVLRDAMSRDKLTDDRPPRMPEGWLANFNECAADIIEKYPIAKEAFTQERSG